MEKLIRKLWPDLLGVWIGNDLETALACLDSNDFEIKAIVIAGTGSCSYGTNGKEIGKVGGYGHRIGKSVLARNLLRNKKNFIALKVIEDQLMRYQKKH